MKFTVETVCDLLSATNQVEGATEKLKALSQIGKEILQEINNQENSYVGLLNNK